MRSSFWPLRSNYSLILQSIPANTRVAVAFTFDLWTDFLAQPFGAGRTLREEIDARLATFASYPPEDIGALAAALEGIRDLFEDRLQTQFAPELEQAIIGTLEDPLYGFDSARKIRARSSTNVEDSERFSGAGLYDSRSGCLLDDVDGDDMGPSHCDPATLAERGIFRAIRRVFASFYNQNAFLERLRWSVDEHEVGMALLVHHSYPDDLELANGVATLTPNGPNYTIDMVTQGGAVSVANPADGSIPETVRVTVFRSGAKPVDLVQESNLVQLGARVLDWKGDYETFGTLFVSVAKAFEEASGKTRYTLDFEYKKIAPGGQLIVKQVRQIPQPESGRQITPFLIDDSRTFTTFQGEAADIFSNQRLKSTWMLETRNMRLSEKNLRDGAISRAGIDYSDGCGVFRFDGEVASLPRVEERFGDDRMLRVSWVFDHLANPRAYELSAGPVPLLVPESGSPFVTLEDLNLNVRVTYELPVLGWEGETFSEPTGPGVGIPAQTSQLSRMSRRNPRSSEPSTRTSLCRRSIDSHSGGPEGSSPTTQNPPSRRRRRARARLTTWTQRRCSTAPAERRCTMAPSPADPRRGRITPSAPKAAADRRAAARFPTSVTWSKASSSPGGGSLSSSSSSPIGGERTIHATTPWWRPPTIRSSSGRGRRSTGMLAPSAMARIFSSGGLSLPSTRTTRRTPLRAARNDSSTE